MISVVDQIAIASKSHTLYIGIKDLKTNSSEIWMLLKRKET
jgi:hypothetical protein